MQLPGLHEPGGPLWFVLLLRLFCVCSSRPHSRLRVLLCSTAQAVLQVCNIPQAVLQTARKVHGWRHDNVPNCLCLLL